MSDVRKLAKIVADHSRQIKGLSGGPQAAYSSIEGGSMDSYDSDGKLRLRIGAQDDGTQGVKYVQGPPPPRPTAPVVSVDGPVVRVRWDGMLMGGHIPEDFARIDVHFALASDDLEADEAVRGNLATSAGNETVLAATQTGTYRVGLVAMSQSRARSEMSDVTEVEVELVNLKGAIDTAVDNASGGSNHYRPAPPEGTDHTENDLWFDTSVDPETGLTAYTPHRWDEAAQEWASVGDQRTAAIQDAQEEFAQELTDAEQRAIDEARDLADQARSDAATDATTKADAARDAAIEAAELKDQQVRADIDAVIDGAVSDLEGEIATVRTSVDGKSRITQSTSAPPTQYDGAVGDRWERMSSMGSGGSLISNWRWNGDVWVSTLISDAVLGNVDAAKIGTGYLDAARIQAGSIYADKIVSGLSQNMVPDPGFVNADINAARLTSAFGYGDGDFSIAGGVLTISTGGTAPSNPNMSLSANTDLYAWAAYPAMRIVAKTEARAASGTASIVMVIRFRRRDGTVGATAMGAYSPLTASWDEYSWAYTLPQDVAGFSIVVQVHRTLSNGVIEMRSPFVASSVGTTVIEDGAVTTGKVAAKAINAGKIAAGAVEAEHIVAGGIEADSLIVAGSLGETLIADGAISTRTVQANAIGAEAIAAGVIEGEHVKAGSLTADKLLVGKVGNMLPNGALEEGSAALWAGDPTYDTSDKPDSQAAAVWWPEGTSATGDLLSTYGNQVLVEPGSSLVIEMWIRATAVGSQFILELRDQDGNHLGRSGHPWEGDGNQAFPFVIPDVPDSWGLFRSTIVVPDGTRSVYVGGAYFNHPSGSRQDVAVGISGLRLRTQASATLIEDGAITTSKIAAGSITAESGIIGSLDAGVITVGEMNGARIEAGTIDTPQLAFGAATGDILSVDALNFKTAVGLDIRSSAFRAGDAVEMTEDFGIRQFGPDGALNVSLPSDGSPAEFRGDLSARTLTATGRMSIQGPGAIASGGVLELESGVVPPVGPPSVSNSLQTTKFPPVADDESVWGLAWAGGSWWRGINKRGVVVGDRIERISPAGELEASFSTGVNPQGLTSVGDELFLLGTLHANSQGTDQVLVYSLTGTLKRRWEYPNYGTGTYQPGIGTDGTNILIAQPWQDGRLTWRRFNKTTGALLAQVDSDRVFRSGINAITQTAGDFGKQQVVITWGNMSGTNEVYETNGTHVPEAGWFANHQQQVKGTVFKDGHFHHITAGGDLVKMSDTRFPNGGPSVDTDDWWAAITWSDGTHETTLGPARRFMNRRRYDTRVSFGTPPDGATNARVYFARGVTEPSRTSFHRVGEVSATAEQSIIVQPIGWESLANPPANNTFPQSTPGLIRSGFGNYWVDGTGAGQWGPLTFHADGTMTSAAVPTWTPITSFNAGFTAATWTDVPAYRVWPDGKVEWRGTIMGTFNGTMLPFVVPPAARAGRTLNFSVACGGTAVGTSATTRLEFSPSGDPGGIRVFRGDSDKTWVDLGSIYYYLT